MARILVVDDDALLRDVLQMHLKRCGHAVYPVGDSIQALEALLNYEFDLVVSDVEMPNMDGLALLEAIRGGEATCELPVIMLTARTDDATKAAAKRLRADRYLTKPVKADQLVHAIDSTLAAVEAAPLVGRLTPRFA